MNQTPEVFLGIPDARPDYVNACRDLGAPIMISASAFAKRWTDEMRDNSEDHPGFRAPPAGRLDGVRTALDSMGFTAGLRWGGYPISPTDYFLQLVRHKPDWAFWSSQDLCCEPAISENPEEIVARLMETAARYDALQRWADCTVVPDGRGVGPMSTFPRPMKIIQGWEWYQYLISADALEVTAEDDVVGIGSVCKRGRSGPAGVLTIIDQLDRRLPEGVRFHLFGVTSTVLEELSSHPRIASMDSQAWGLALRKNHPTGRTNALAVEYMARFYRAQRAHVERGGKGMPPAATLALRPPPIWSGRTPEYRQRAAEVLHAIRNGHLEAWKYGLRVGLFLPESLGGDAPDDAVGFGKAPDQDHWLSDHGEAYAHAAPPNPVDNPAPSLEPVDG